ncbi:MAG TPA: phytase [Planctomycetota bacterium]
MRRQPSRLTADVEGLAIYYGPGGSGYLIASSQGINTFVVHDRQPPHAYRFTFQIVANTTLGIDGVTDCDGIDVLNLGPGSAFPNGVFPGAGRQQHESVGEPELQARVLE